MDRYRGTRRRAVVGAAMLSIGALWGVGAAVSAHSPEPSAAVPSAAVETPAASFDVAAECGRLAGLLPSELSDAPLEWQAAGADDAVMGDLASLFETLEVDPADFCQVAYRYGEDDLSEGFLLQFGGADPAAVVTSLVDFLTAEDTDLTFERIDTTISGKPVMRVEATQGDDEPQVVLFYGFGDVVAVGQVGAPFEAVLAALPAPGQPLPDVTAPPTLAPTPEPSF